MPLSRLAARRFKILLEQDELNVSSIIERLAQTQASFLRVADEIPAGQWNAKINVEKWSGAEVVAHLVLVECGVIERTEHVIQRVPLPIRPWKKAHLPIWLVEARIIRRKSPIPMDPTLIGSKEEMLHELCKTRERTVALVEETHNRDLSAYRWRHPFLGSLNVYEWFEMIAAHEVRHAKQMKEIASQLPKVVEISQNQ